MEKDFHKRLNLISLLVFISVLIVIFRLGYVQIVHGADYRSDSDNNRYRQVTKLAPRGMVFDANGITMAANQPGYFVSMYHTRAPELDSILEKVAQILDPNNEDSLISVEEFKKRLNAARYRRWQPVRLTDRPLPFGDPRLLQVEERRLELPGVFIDVQPVRSYPLGAVAGHILGAMGRYTGTAGDLRDLLARGFQGYRLDSIVGRWGVEAAYEFVPREMSLKGVDGWQWVEVDNLSRPVQELDRVEPIPGNNIYLTIDAELQQHIEQWMPQQLERTIAAARAAGVRGADLDLVAREAAAVAIDPKTGKILMMVSHPSFSPLDLVQNYSQLAGDPARPLENKVLSAYPPGSVFKPITEIAGIVAGVKGNLPRVVCDGRLYHPWLDVRGKPCWINSYGDRHGTVNDVAALRVSCNIYYYQMGFQLITRLGSANVLDAIANTASYLGLGIPTNVNDLRGFRQDTGILPTSERFRQEQRLYIQQNPRDNRSLNPYPGEVADITIGQGIQTYTPLQMANYMCMLATGHRYQNYIVERIVNPEGEVVMQAEPQRLASLVRTEENPQGLISEADLRTIQEGLRQVTQVTGLGLNSGTAAGAFRTAHYFTSGKTGTAEVYRGVSALPSHGWFAGWAADPATREPEIVVTVFVKHGRGGSAAAAPIAREIMDTYFRLKAARTAQ